MGNENKNSIDNSNSEETAWTSQEKDEEEAREELPSVVPKDQNHEIPNGGFKAWLQVLGSFFLFFNSWFVSRAYHAPSPFHSPHYVV
jgi:hypothetical protein